MLKMIGRKYFPSSEWLYLKLYASPSDCDKLVAYCLPGFIEQYEARLISWFFIRYSDPHCHIRLRFRGDPEFLLTILLPCVIKGIGEDPWRNLIWKVQLDTYTREMERYGGPECIELIEKIFQLNSSCTMKFLSRFSGGSYLDLRWRIAIFGIDIFLQAAGLSYRERLDILSQLTMKLSQELNLDSLFKYDVSRKYRLERHLLELLLFGDDGQMGADVSEAKEIIIGQYDVLRSCVEQLLKLLASNSNSGFSDSVISSIIHMNLNRILRSAHSTQELVIYGFMQRLYRTVVSAKKPHLLNRFQA